MATIALVRASVSDAPLIWELQKRAFRALLYKYRDFDVNPGNETLERVQEKLKQDFTYFYLITLDKATVGGIRVIDNKRPGERKKISPLFVLPEYQGRGVAQQAIGLAEQLHGDHCWQLDTILQEQGNCYLYEKLGYVRTGKTEVINGAMTLVFYEKE